MRISELSTQSGVPVPTIKYYLREGILPEGERTAPTQASYDERHVQRLRVIRALIGSGVTIAETRRVLDALDGPPRPAHELLGAAHAAVTPPAEPGVDLADAVRLAEGLGWREGACDPHVLADVARALQGLQHARFEVPDDVMTVYLESVRRIARAEVAGVPTDSAEAAVRYVVLGSVLVEPLLLALRRVAEQIASAERFGTGDESSVLGGGSGSDAVSGGA